MKQNKPKMQSNTSSDGMFLRLCPTGISLGKDCTTSVDTDIELLIAWQTFAARGGSPEPSFVSLLKCERKEAAEQIDGNYRFNFFY